MRVSCNDLQCYAVYLNFCNETQTILVALVRAAFNRDLLFQSVTSCDGTLVMVY